MKILYNTIIVEDLDESISFYRDNLGFEIESEHRNLLGDTEIVILKGDCETHLELIKNPSFNVGFYSIGMEVDNIEEKVEELVSKGLKFEMGIVEITIGKMARFKDLNGVNIVLIEHV